MADTTPALPPDLQRRQQEAATRSLEAAADKAQADATAAANTTTMSQYSALLPDLGKADPDSLDDKDSGVAFGGLVTYKALERAADQVAGKVLTGDLIPAGASVLVTTAADLLSKDLVRQTVVSGVMNAKSYADKVLSLKPDDKKTLLPVLIAGQLVAAAIPSILSMFSSKTTVKGQDVPIDDLSAVTAVLGSLLHKGVDRRLALVQDDFRLGPDDAPVFTAFNDLASKRADLVMFRQEQQVAKNIADLHLTVDQGAWPPGSRS